MSKFITNYQYVSYDTLYKYYPYKCKDLTKTKNYPIIKKSEMICDHKYSIFYPEYKKIIRTYFKYLCQYLVQGSTFKIPHGLGIFVIKKFRNKSSGWWWKFVYNKETGSYDRIKEKNTHSRQFTLRLNWIRDGEARFKYQNIYRIRPTKPFKKMISENIRSNLSNLNNYKKW